MELRTKETDLLSRGNSKGYTTKILKHENIKNADVSNERNKQNDETLSYRNKLFLSISFP